jgi:hypothetical protein
MAMSGVDQYSELFWGVITQRMTFRTMTSQTQRSLSIIRLKVGELFGWLAEIWRESSRLARFQVVRVLRSIDPTTDYTGMFMHTLENYRTMRVVP